ncbi:MAG TPA: PIG-L family deacetylase [Desulfomonilaceae bacterium]|nr:PIG-L family deacetylase [Desulfomonilaceae bacterium]
MQSDKSTCLDGSAYLFLFAHPDDDVFVAGTMKLLLDRGADIHCAWVTSGDYFGQQGQREEELAGAMRILGLGKESIHLLRYPDLGLVSRLDQAADAVAALMELVRPDIVFANAFEGGHPDHDSVNFLAYEGCARAGMSSSLYEFPVYNGSGPFYYWWWRINRFPDDGVHVLHNPLADDAILCKYKMMRIYAASQWMYMIPARLASSKNSLRNVGEPYRECPSDRDHTVRPHGGKLNYERWFNFFMRIRFKDFQRSVLNARSKGR